ncbi:MAG: 16S rRNA (uracil(1498)-N(3))-methyltransferase [Thermodesulfobacteriota bacterium]
MMRRFFIRPDTEIASEILLSKEESHHVSRVLRLPVGTPLQLLDGCGNVHDAEILEIRKQVRLRILSSNHAPPDATPLRVCQAMLKGQKMELLIQKCTELGVREFTPFYSERCQLKKSELTKVEKKYERWQRIVEEACKQCGTPWAMELKPLRSYEEMLGEGEGAGQKILFWEEQQHEESLHSHPVQESEAGVQLVFGPEGGFPESEVKLAREAGFQILSLGPRILKAETANIGAVAIVQYLLNNM